MNLGHLTILQCLFPNQSHPFYCLDDPLHHQSSHWHLCALCRVLPGSQTPVHSLYHLTASSTLSGASCHSPHFSSAPSPSWSLSGLAAHHHPAPEFSSSSWALSLSDLHTRHDTFGFHCVYAGFVLFTGCVGCNIILSFRQLQTRSYWVWERSHPED